LTSISLIFPIQVVKVTDVFVSRKAMNVCLLFCPSFVRGQFKGQVHSHHCLTVTE